MCGISYLLVSSGLAGLSVVRYTLYLPIIKKLPSPEVTELMQYRCHLSIVNCGLVGTDTVGLIAGNITRNDCKYLKRPVSVPHLTSLDRTVGGVLCRKKAIEVIVI